jgi:hypothetical protein
MDAVGRGLRSDSGLEKTGESSRSHQFSDCRSTVRLSLLQILIASIADLFVKSNLYDNHTNVISLDNSKRCCMTSYRALGKLVRSIPVEEHGVRMRMANFFHKDLNDTPDQLEKMVEIEGVKDVRARSPNRLSVSFLTAFEFRSKASNTTRHSSPNTPSTRRCRLLPSHRTAHRHRSLHGLSLPTYSERAHA